jgi:hypothetical protein
MAFKPREMTEAELVEEALAHNGDLMYWGEKWQEHKTACVTCREENNVTCDTGQLLMLKWMDLAFAEWGLG